MTDLADAFVRLHARLTPVPLIPEILLHQADEPIGLWELTEGQFRSEQPPPFWAFAWAGGQGLARYVLDHPEVVAGRRVLDVACGSGLVGIAAAKAGAASVRAVDIDPLAIAAVGVNAAANGVSVAAEEADILDGPAGADVVLAGDVYYSQSFATRMFNFLRRARKAGADAYAGDPGRAFRPGAVGTEVASYEVPTTMALESVTRKHTSVFRLA